MAGGANLGEDEAITGINIVPLVDIVLVLLIIFMVTAEFLREEPEEPPPGIEVELPTAASGENVNEGLLALVINKQGDLFLNGKPATEGDVKSFIANAGKPPKEIEAFIAADKGISHGDVVGVIDFLRLQGVERFAINTKSQSIE
jgi:biopolymer transport protein ExbD